MTIILLLILAGVTIHFTLRENGILKNAETAGEKYEEANAKEQLTLELANIQTKKYKETGKKATLEDIKNLINKNKYDVTIEEGVSSATIENLENEYTFIVDEHLTIQDVEKIANQDKTIKIEISATNTNDYVSSKIKVTITLGEEITSIKIRGEEIEIPTPEENEDGKKIYEVEKDVTENGSYKVKVETVSGRTNSKLQTVSNLSEDMNIYTANDLVRFRERVCKGATYEGRTITVMNNIDLSSVCGKNVGGKEVSWKPIGHKILDPENADDDYTYFKGTFNGQYKAINNLYINTDEYEIAGLFCYNSGTIRNLIMNNVYIYVDYSESVHATEWGNYIGSIIAYNEGTIENVGVNSGSITNINLKQPIIKWRTQNIGGIAGQNYGEIKKCYNFADIETTNISNNNNNMTPQNFAGGIVGHSSGTIANCYNVANITANGAYLSAPGGLVGREYETEIKNCYNYGAVMAQKGLFNLAGGICGQNGWKNNQATVINCYYLNTVTTYSHWYNTATHYTTGSVTEDTLKGYASILNEKDEEGNEIEVWVEDTTGINNGYPILKWQVTKK